MKKVLILTLTVVLALSAISPAFADEVATEVAPEAVTETVTEPATEAVTEEAPAVAPEAVTEEAPVVEPEKVIPAVPAGVTGVTVYINNAYLDCSAYGQNAFIKDDRTLVPLRSIFEALGATVEWDEATEGITATRGVTTINLKIGDKKMYVGDNVVELDVPASLTDAGRTVVPVRAVSEAFGAKVEWIAETEQVLITTDLAPVTELPVEGEDKVIAEEEIAVPAEKAEEVAPTEEAVVPAE